MGALITRDILGLLSSNSGSNLSKSATYYYISVLFIILNATRESWLPYTSGVKDCYHERQQYTVIDVRPPAQRQFGAGHFYFYVL